MVGYTSGKVAPRRHNRENGTPPAKDTPHKGKGMTDEAMMNIICDDIATNTTAAALRGDSPPPQPVMELPYTGSRAMLRLLVWRHFAS